MPNTLRASKLCPGCKGFGAVPVVTPCFKHTLVYYILLPQSETCRETFHGVASRRHPDENPQTTSTSAPLNAKKQTDSTPSSSRTHPQWHLQYLSASPLLLLQLHLSRRDKWFGCEFETCFCHSQLFRQNQMFLFLCCDVSKVGYHLKKKYTSTNTSTLKVTNRVLHLIPFFLASFSTCLKCFNGISAHWTTLSLTSPHHRLNTL